MNKAFRWLPLALTATTACVAPTATPDEPVDRDALPISGGGGQNPVTLAVALLDAGGPQCSASFLSPDLALTSSDCQIIDVVATLGSGSSKIRVWRFPNPGAKGVVVLQTARQMPLAPRYARGVDPVPLAQNEVVTCVGYDDARAPALHSGSFKVADGSGSGMYFLRPVGAPYEVSFLDRGGYCSRDGSNEIAAILTRESVNGVAQAAAVDGLSSSLGDIRRAELDSRAGVAVRFRATSVTGPEFLTDKLMTPPGIGIEPLAPVDTHQAFYLERVSNPPGGGSDWYRLVSARDGHCLAQHPTRPGLTDVSCRGQREEVFYVESLGNLAYRLHATGGCVDADPNGLFASGYVSVVPCSGAQSQNWEMWLTRY